MQHYLYKVTDKGCTGYQSCRADLYYVIAKTMDEAIKKVCKLKPSGGLFSLSRNNIKAKVIACTDINVETNVRLIK